MCVCVWQRVSVRMCKCYSMILAIVLNLMQSSQSGETRIFPSEHEDLMPCVQKEGESLAPWSLSTGGCDRALLNGAG